MMMFVVLLLFLFVLFGLFLFFWYGTNVVGTVTIRIVVVHDRRLIRRSRLGTHRHSTVHTGDIANPTDTECR